MIISYQKELEESFSSSKMVNQRLTLTQLLPQIYRYSDDTHPKHLLHLMGGGKKRALIPFNALFRLQHAFLFIHVVRGGIRLSDGKTDDILSVTEGQCILYPCNGRFTIQTQLLPLDYRIFLITGDPIEEYLPYIKRNFTTTVREFPGILTSTEKLLEQKEEITSHLTALTLHRYLTDLLTPLAEHAEKGIESTHIPKPILAMHDFIEHHSDGSFSLAYFESTYRISRQQLCRDYKKHYGIPPLKDFNQRRIERAKNILLSSDLQVQEISSIVGYDNVNHFIDLFQKNTGLTPGKFRQMGQAHRL